MIKGITKRWVLNTLCAIVAVIVLMVASLSYGIQAYCYSMAEQSLSARCAEFASTLSDYSSELDSGFMATARDYVESFSDKEKMEVSLINSSGRVSLTSTGFSPDNNETLVDYTGALSSPSGTGKWTGKLSSGENVLAVTRLVRNSDGINICAVRCVISLTNINTLVYSSIAVLCGVGLLIIVLVILSGNYFIRSIVKPVRRVSDTAKRIAQGDFNAQIDKMYDDEIGDLCDSINDMARELGAADRMKNDFISSVSHELRTPLTAIKGWAETMQVGDMPDKETFDKGMGIIVKESSRLTSIVEELLDFSKLQSGRMVLMNEKLDIVAELDEVLYILRERAVEEGKHLLYDQPEAMPAVMGDRNKLRQVFFNIIDNALKYTQREGVVGIQIQSEDEYVLVVVTDTGCGIAPDDLPRVKDKFFKANQSVRGSGIGLAVADEIVTMHGGTLNIESGIGVGTTVTISLPQAKEQN